MHEGAAPAETRRSSRPLRVAYLSGPSEADRVYDDLIESKPATYFGTNYMRQFLLLMLDLKAEALVETWHGGGAYRRRKGPFVFSNVPEPKSSGIWYHLGQIRRQLGVLWRSFRFRPDVVVLTGKQGYWWMLAPLRLFGIKMIASFHCVLWPQFGAMKRHERILLGLDRALLLSHLNAAVSTSKVITDQFASAVGSGATGIPLFQHLPTYDPEQFSHIESAEPVAGEPFCVMFTGRIEQNKGVFDLLAIASELRNSRPNEFEFDICGDGSAMNQVRERVEKAGLQEVVRLHGYCAPDRLKKVMSASHAVVVPTRSDFEAGFEMTCAEAVLSGRPLITSAVCPALEYLRPAAIEVPPDDVDAYKQAIEQLKDDPALFMAKRDACRALSGQFFDQYRSWDHAIKLALAKALPKALAGSFRLCR